MKKLLILMNFILLILLISSCEDLLNPDPEVHKTKIKHHIIVKDQEHSVIMPLKIGNMWIYKVSSVRDNGKTEFIGYDTLLVKRDTIIKGEKWFIAKDPSSNSKEVVLTNTDVGLLCNPHCFCGLLRAEYPVKYITYLYMESEFPTKMKVFNDQGKFVGQRVDWYPTCIWIDVENIQDYPIFNKYFDCYIYTMRGKHYQNGKRHYITIFEASIEYFVPDLGLVRKDFSRFENDDSSAIFKRIELVSTNVKI